MQKPNKLFVLVVMASFTAASGATVFAESSEQKHKYESGMRYEMEGKAAVRSDSDQQQRSSVLNNERKGQVNTSHWKVTDAVSDHTGRLTMLQHIVPLHDMAVFGSVTNNIIANGLNIERVDAVFNESDTETQGPHYHFTQMFQI